MVNKPKGINELNNPLPPHLLTSYALYISVSYYR